MGKLLLDSLCTLLVMWSEVVAGCHCGAEASSLESEQLLDDGSKYVWSTEESFYLNFYFIHLVEWKQWDKHSQLLKERSTISYYLPLIAKRSFTKTFKYIHNKLPSMYNYKNNINRDEKIKLAVLQSWHNPTRQLQPLKCIRDTKWHHKGGQGLLFFEATWL